MFPNSSLFAEKYFIAEKSESMLFVIVGVAAMVLAFLFYVVLKTPFYKGAAIPLLAIAILQIVVGYTVYKRSDAQGRDIVDKLNRDPGAIQQQEIPRIDKVMNNFVIYRWVEIALLTTGLVIVFLYRNDAAKTFWYGMGVALATQAAVMLAADYFAEKRGKVYVKELRSAVGK